MPLTVWPHCLIFCCCIPILIAMFPYTPQQNILMAAVQDAMCLSMTDFLCFKEPYMRTKLFVLYYLWLRTDEFVIYRHISRFFFFGYVAAFVNSDLAFLSKLLEYYIKCWFL